MAKQDMRQRALRKGLEHLRKEGLPVDDLSRAVVGLLKAHFGRGREADLALVFLLGRIADPSALEALILLEQTAADREVKREVRRSLFKLAQRGLIAPQREPVREAHEKPAFRLGPDFEGYLSSVDGAGNRLVWLAKPQLGGGLRLLQGIVNDREGLMQVRGSPMRRKELSLMISEIEEKHGVSMIPIPWDYGDFILYEAFEKAKGLGRSGLEQFPQLRAHLNPAKAKPRPHPVYDHLSADEIRSGPWRESSQKLLEEPEFRSWVLDEDWLEPHLGQVEQAQESRLVLNPLQKEERLAGIIRDAVRELFADEVGRLFSGRMEDMALYLFLTGREVRARSALAVALALRDKDLGGLGVPFLQGLMQRSVAFYMTQDEKRPEEGSLIIKP
ncbi:MAG: hypothetical protein ACE5JU_15310 [Candidatus Binatia bacterium]